MHSVLDCHTVAKHAKFCLGELCFNVTSTGNAGCFKKLYNGIPSVTVWQVLRKRLHLKAYELSIVQVVNMIISGLRNVKGRFPSSSF
jgi:hypothetical protein